MLLLFKFNNLIILLQFLELKRIQKQKLYFIILVVLYYHFSLKNFFIIL